MMILEYYITVMTMQRNNFYFFKRQLCMEEKKIK